MELYTYDDDFVKQDTVDTFTSLIWTERYSSFGDCTVVAPQNSKNVALLTEDTWLRTNTSDDIMLIEEVNTKNKQITAKGTSLLKFLAQRFFRNIWSNTPNTQGGWVVNDTEIYKVINAVLRLAVNPGTVMINGAVLTAAQGANEIIPNLAISPFIPEGVNDRVDVTVPYGDVYGVIKALADVDGLGLKLLPNADDQPGMTFQMYRGLNRTSVQDDNDVIILDPGLGNFTDIETLRSKVGYKNVCWVWPNDLTAQTHIGRASVDGGELLTGFKRRTMQIVSSTIKIADYPSNAALQRALTVEGLNALINNNYIRMVDGQMVLKGDLVYGVNYGLGDILELRSVGGEISSAARVTEYIRSQDANGESAYPTLSVIG